MQNYVNLFFPEEREMLPLSGAERIGVIPWSPLARGRLTRDWDDATDRSATEEFGRRCCQSKANRSPHNAFRSLTAMFS